MLQRSVETPFGALCVTQEDDVITRVDWGHAGDPSDTPLLAEAIRQIQAYCTGDLTQFDLPLEPSGGTLQQSVCAQMRQIPFGETCTYGDIAKRVQASAQAVGQACGGNSIPVIIPCHRVMGAGGKLTGFSGAGGVETKVALLRHERAGGFLI